MAESDFDWIYAYSLAVTPEFFIGNNTINFCIKGIITAKSDIGAGMYLGAQLAHKDISCLYDLAAESFHTSSLTYAVTSVPGTTACFFMCHDKASINYHFF
jgi:hypothetical protein